MTEKENEKHYLRSDGNGGLNISHSVAIISLIIMILLAIIPAAVAWGVLSARVDNYYDLEQYQKETIDDLEQEVGINKEDIAVVETQITNLKDDITEIKGDVKTLIKSLI